MNFSPQQIKLAGDLGEEETQRDFEVGLDLQGSGIRSLRQEVLSLGELSDCEEELPEATDCSVEKAELEEEIVALEADLITCADDYDDLTDAIENTLGDIYPETPDEPDDSTGESRFSFMNIYGVAADNKRFIGFCQAYIYQQGARVYLNVKWSPSGSPITGYSGGFNVNVGGMVGQGASSLTPDPNTVNFNLSAGAGAQIGDTFAITVTAFSRCETCGPGGFAAQNTLPLGGSGLVTVTGVSPYVVNISTNFGSVISTVF